MNICTSDYSKRSKTVDPLASQNR